MGIYLKRYTQDKPPLGSQIDWGHPLSKGLVACFLMNEGGGLKVNDIARGNNGTIREALWIPASKGIGLDFDGTNDQVDCGSSAQIDNLVPLSVSVWFNPDAIGGALVTKGSQYSGTDAGWRVYLSNYNEDNQMVFGCSWSTSDGRWVGVKNTIIAAGKWCHLVVTYNRNSSSDVPKIYANGILVVATEITIPAGNFVSDASYNLNIGNYDDFDSVINGKILMTQIWNRALSSSEIQQLYQDPYQFIQTPKNRIYSYLTPAVVTGQPRSYGYLF